MIKDVDANDVFYEAVRTANKYYKTDRQNANLMRCALIMDMCDKVYTKDKKGNNTSVRKSPALLMAELENYK